MLFDAFVTMVNQLPDYCLNWLRSTLRKARLHAHIADGSEIFRAGWMLIILLA